MSFKNGSHLESFCAWLLWSLASCPTTPTSMIFLGAFTVTACSFPSEFVNWCGLYSALSLLD